MSTFGVTRIGSAPLAGAFTRATPTVTVTAPGGTLSSTPITVTWTWSSPVGHDQAYYRVRILSQDGGSVVYDTGILPGDDLTTSLTVLLSGGSSYLFAVSAADLYDWSDEVTVGVFYDAVEVSEYPDCDDAGTVYEVAINGVGYMLADHPDKDIRYERRTASLESPRLATGDTPFSQAIDRYAIISHSDWSDGSGQRFYKRDSSTDKGYYDSEGVNPFTAGEARLLPSTSLHHSDSYSFSKAVVASNRLYVTSASGELSAYDDPSDVSVTAVSITGASTPVDLASDGTYWYFTDGSNIYRNSTAADPGSAWSTENADIMEWCTDRLVIAKKTGSSTKPNALATLNYTTGAVSGPASGSNPFTFEEETDIRSITAGDGYVWWGAVRYDRSVVYAWQLGSTDSYFTAFELPAGQEVQTVGYYQGNVFIRASETIDGSTKRAIIYRGVPSSGALTVSRVLQIADDSTDHAAGDFAGDDRFVYFSWKAMGTYSGVGCIDLSTGGWAKWLEAPASTGLVRSICQWYGKTVFTIDGYGAVVEKAPSGGNDQSVATGYITSSITDLNTSLRKGWERVEATFDPLPSGATITVSYSLDGGTSFTALSPSVTSAGQKSASWNLQAEADSIILKATLTHGSTTTPVLRAMSVRAHALGLADQLLVLPINCADQIAGLHGRVIAADSGPGKGAARARALEALAQTRVRVQDIDWKETDTAYVYDVVAVEVRSVGVMSKPRNRQDHAQVAVVQLRRSLK